MCSCLALWVGSCDYPHLMAALEKQSSPPRELQSEPCQARLPHRHLPTELWSKTCQFAVVKMMAAESMAQLCQACHPCSLPWPSMEAAVASAHWDRQTLQPLDPAPT